MTASWSAGPRVMKACVGPEPMHSLSGDRGGDARDCGDRDWSARGHACTGGERQPRRLRTFSAPLSWQLPQSCSLLRMRHSATR